MQDGRHPRGAEVVVEYSLRWTSCRIALLTSMISRYFFVRRRLWLASRNQSMHGAFGYLNSEGLPSHDVAMVAKISVHRSMLLSTWRMSRLTVSSVCDGMHNLQCSFGMVLLAACSTGSSSSPTRQQPERNTPRLSAVRQPHILPITYQNTSHYKDAPHPLDCRISHLMNACPLMLTARPSGCVCMLTASLQWYLHL